MPMYEYLCRDCERCFEELIRNRQDEQEVACPDCGSKVVHRVLSGFAVGGGGRAASTASSCGASSRYG